MILTDKAIRLNKILSPCEERGKQRGMSYGLSHCGYDVRASITGPDSGTMVYVGGRYVGGVILRAGESELVAVREHFDMPIGVCGFAKDKSTWARRGLLVSQAVLEPGWKGYLTLRLTNVSKEDITIADGDPIAQIVFQWLDGVPERTYTGKYQGQQRGPQGPRFEE